MFGGANFIDPDSYRISNVLTWKPDEFISNSAQREQLMKIAYHFDFDYKDCRDPSQHRRQLQRGARELELDVEK